MKPTQPSPAWLSILVVVSLLVSPPAVLGQSFISEPAREAHRVQIETALKESPAVSVLVWVKSSASAATVAGQAKNFEIKYLYDACNGFAGTTDREGFAALSADPRVDYIVPDGRVQAHLAQSRVVIQANLVETQMGLTGQGVGVAVLDTGINHNHANLASQYFGGYDYINNDPDPLDDNGHGSAVCGVIASTNATNRGVAPGAHLVAVKVLDATGFGLWSQIAAGLNWCVSNKAAYNIRVANMSIGVGGSVWTPGTNPGYVEPALAACSSASIPVVVSAGNDGSIFGISYPAISPYAISVGATYDANLGSQTNGLGGGGACTDPATAADKVCCFSNRTSYTTIMAPGSLITTTTGSGSGFTSWFGTSFAAPHVAGTIALMVQRAPNIPVTPVQLAGILASSGVPVLDTVSGLTFKRLNALAAVQAMPAANFSAAPTSGTFPLTVAFSDLSTIGATSWAWSFGDGGTSTSQNPSHVYAAIGTYSVVLTATGPSGSDVETKTGYVVVAAPPVISSVTPASVQAFQGGLVTVTGANFSGATQVQVGSAMLTPPAFTIVNGTTITFNAPTPSALGATGVSVTTPAGTSNVMSFNYVETFPAALSNASITFNSLSYVWSYGGGATDTAYLIASTDPTTSTFGTPYSWIANFTIMSTTTLRATGLGSTTIIIPAGLAGTIFYSQIGSFDGVTGVFSASNVTMAHILF